MKRLHGIDWTQYRASKQALHRISLATGWAYLGVNGLGDEVYLLEGPKARDGKPYHLYLHRFSKPTRAGKLGQVYVYRADAVPGSALTVSR